MDPLSLTANVIAVVSAARSAVRSLKRLKDARLAPIRITQLLDEVHDFERVVTAVERTINIENDQPIDPIFNQHLALLIQQAKKQMMAVNQLVEDRWIKELESMDQKAIKVFWKTWLISKDILQISEKIRTLRQEMAAALTVLTA